MSNDTVHPKFSGNYDSELVREMLAVRLEAENQLRGNIDPTVHRLIERSSTEICNHFFRKRDEEVEEA